MFPWTTVTRVLLLAVIAVVGLWALIVIVFGPNEATVSVQLAKAIEKHRILAAALGAFVAHIVTWSLHP